MERESGVGGLRGCGIDALAFGVYISGIKSVEMCAGKFQRFEVRGDLL